MGRHDDWAFKPIAQEREELEVWAKTIKARDTQCTSYQQVGGFRRPCIRKAGHPADWHIDIHGGTWR